MKFTQAFESSFYSFPNEEYVRLIDEYLNKGSLFKITNENENKIRELVSHSLELGNINITKILLLSCYNFSRDTEDYLLENIKNFGITKDIDGYEYTEETLRLLGDNKFSVRDDYNKVIVYNEKFMSISEELLKFISTESNPTKLLESEKIAEIEKLINIVNSYCEEDFFDQLKVKMKTENMNDAERCEFESEESDEDYE